ncbi:MAG: hypothetical protein ACHQIG_12325, partial [Acidimicrobiia bacterium]
LLAGSAMAVLRGSVGFLAFFVAFALKDDLFGLGAALVASAIGGFIGVVAAPLLRKSMREEVILASSLVLPAVFALLATLFGGSVGFVVAAFALAIGAAAGRLGFDSLLQRDGPEAARGRAFARFETRFQVTWVIGGMFGLIPVAESIGLVGLGGVLGFAAVSYVGALRAASKRGMRTKLLPDSVHRELHRSRSQALSKVRGKFRKSTPASGDPPGEVPGTE